MCKIYLEISAVSCKLNVKNVKCFTIQVTLMWTLFFFFVWDSDLSAGPMSTVLKTDQLSQLLLG